MDCREKEARANSPLNARRPFRQSTIGTIEMEWNANKMRLQDKYQLKEELEYLTFNTAKHKRRILKDCRQIRTHLLNSLAIATH